MGWFLLPIQLGFGRNKRQFGETMVALAKKSARFDDPGEEGWWPREGSVTRKGREGPAARAAKTHRRRRGFEKVDRLHPLKGQRLKGKVLKKRW